MNSRFGRLLLAYGLVPLAGLALVNLHCGAGNTGGSGSKCGTGQARISGTTPYCQDASSISFEAFTPTCGTLERPNAVACDPGGSCSFEYLFTDMDTTVANSTQFTGEWSCDGRQLTFMPNNVEIKTGPATQVTAHF